MLQTHVTELIILVKHEGSCQNPLSFSCYFSFYIFIYEIAPIKKESKRQGRWTYDYILQYKYVRGKTVKLTHFFSDS